jgi:hypothetical protein
MGMGPAMEKMRGKGWGWRRADRGSARGRLRDPLYARTTFFRGQSSNARTTFNLGRREYAGYNVYHSETKFESSNVLYTGTEGGSSRLIR